MAGQSSHHSYCPPSFEPVKQQTHPLAVDVLSNTQTDKQTNTGEVLFQKSLLLILDLLLFFLYALWRKGLTKMLSHGK